MISKLIVLAGLVTISQSRFVDVKIFELFGHATNRMIGGHDAKLGEFPHQVSLQIGLPERLDFQHFCGGTILNEKWILTAVHCLDGYEEINLQAQQVLSEDLIFLVKAGKHNLDGFEDTEQTVLVDKYYKHPKYNNKLQVGPYDVGLIKVKVPFKFNKRVAAIALPKQSVEPTDGVILSGWGALNGKEKPDMPSILQTVSIPIVSRKACNKAVKDVIYEETHQWLNVDLVHETNICTGPLDGGVSACGGDSGGPLIKRNNNGKDEVVGIVSWGLVPCGRKGAPSIYVKVSDFVDWIEEKMELN